MSIIKAIKDALGDMQEMPDIQVVAIEDGEPAASVTHYLDEDSLVGNYEVHVTDAIRVTDVRFSLTATRSTEGGVERRVLISDEPGNTSFEVTPDAPAEQAFFLGQVGDVDVALQTLEYGSPEEALADPDFQLVLGIALEVEGARDWVKADIDVTLNLEEDDVELDNQVEIDKDDSLESSPV